MKALTIARWLADKLKVSSGLVMSVEMALMISVYEDHISSNESYEKLLFFYGGTANLDNPDYAIDFFGRVYLFGWVLVRILTVMVAKTWDSITCIILPIRLDSQLYMEGHFKNKLFLMEKQVITHVQSMASVTSTTMATLILPRHLPLRPQIQPTTDPSLLWQCCREYDNPIKLIYCQYGVSRGSNPWET